jgi:hypothetical protein
MIDFKGAANGHNNHNNKTSFINFEREKESESYGGKP